MSFMGQVVYADLLFLIDFSMDFLCFYVTARLLHRNFRLLRCIAGAAVGGIYSVLAVVFPMNTVLGLIADLGVCGLMCLCAFGWGDGSFYEFTLCTSVYFGVSAGLGGVMTAIYSMLNRISFPFPQGENFGDGISVWMFGLLAAISGTAAMLGGRFFRNAASVKVADVEISYGGKSVSLKAFVDTGNMLADPMSGKSVVVVDKRIVGRIMDEKSLEEAVNGRPERLSEYGHRHVRLIPIGTAAGSSMLVAFEPERMAVTVADKKQKSRTAEIKALFAPAEISLSSDKTAAGCHALISPELLI